ncbi:MAG: DAK2 domain-containing protein [Sporichthyaceae bacterium]
MAGDREFDATVGARLRGVDVRRCAREALVALGRAREEIDALNVFPVADSDTGTNLYLTMEAAVQAAEALDADAEASACLAALARGSLTGAWGNSGVILAQMIRGAVAALLEADAGVPGARLFADALRRGTELAYAAVDRPTEGTMLTVLRAAADAAVAPDLGTAGTRAAAAAAQALELTPLQLEVLARAGVVDAGGRGLTVLLDVLAAQLSGVTRMTPPPRTRLPVPDLRAVGCETSSAGFELMFLFDGDTAAAARLRADLANLGDSLVVVGDEELWNVHLHTDDCGAAVEVAVRFGRPHNIRMTTLTAPAPPPGEAPRGRVVLALAAGPGLAKLLEEAGAAVLEVAPGAVPATSALLEALRRPDAAEVVLLPNDRDSHAACEAAAAQARHAGITVSVLPTAASVQALAALAVHDPGRRFAEDVVAMTAAAGATRHGAVFIAPTDAVTSAGLCSAGDALGLIDGDVVLIGADPEAVGAELLERLLGGGGELLTLIAGQGLEPEATHRLAETLHRNRPEVECIVFDGGQPDYPLLLGVE